MKKKPKIVVVGHITLDEYNGKLVPGGSAYYCSQTYLALGAEVKLISTIGGDFQFDGIFDGIDTFIRRTGKTTQFRNTYKKDTGRKQVSLAQAEPISCEDLPEDFKECDVLHLAPVIDEIDIKKWLTVIQSKEVAVGLQGWVRTINSSKIVLPKPCDFTDEEYKKISILCLSEEDIKNQVSQLNRMVKHVPVVAFTHGANGYDLYQHGVKNSYGVYRTSEVDPTGAGDVFASGLIYGIASGKSYEEAGYLGAGLASVIIEDYGGNAFPRIVDGVLRASFVRSEKGVAV